MSFSEVIAPLLGRIAIGWYLLSQAWTYTQDWQGTMDLLKAHNIAAPPVLFALFLAMVAIAAVALIIGYQTRHFAMALFAVMLAIAILLHNYWTMHGDARAEAFDMFSRDMLLMGALLLLVGLGAGRFAADNTGKKKGGH
ncbi:MAG TPA: DoxX family protein [Rhizomicrobium sp.]|nr:DoxX family protein [Rhizomicrobium sp.]